MKIADTKTKYVFGGGRNQSDIKNGIFDCSSFVHHAFKQAGIDLGPLTSTSTETLKNKGTAVKGLENAKPGDLIFFDTYKTNGHVGIYMGDGKFIGAQSSTGVAVVDLNSSKGKYFMDRFSGNIRRVEGASGVNSSDSSSSYNNYWKTQKESSKASGYKGFNSYLTVAMGRAGVSGDNWKNGLTEIVGRESTWNTGAKNGKHTGYGQFTPENIKTYEKKLGIKYDSGTNQIQFIIAYIKDRYGTIEKALKHHDEKGWY